jgi:hypothetical protein
MIDRGVSRRPHEVAFRQVDVFSAAPLGGNGLGVVMLDEPLDAPLMLAITRELRQFETIFLDGIDDDGASAQVFTPAPTVCSATAGPAGSPPHPNAAPSPRETADVVSPPAINRRTGARRITWSPGNRAGTPTSTTWLSPAISTMINARGPAGASP